MFQSTSVGLHISDSGMAIVGMRQSMGRPETVAQEMIALDRDRPLSDQMAEIKNRLVAFVGEHRMETAGRFLGIASSSMMWRRISLPAAARENLADAIRYEAEKYLPLPLEEFYWDFQLIDNHRAAGELTVLLAVVKRVDMAPFLELTTHLPGGLSGVEPATSAIANACRHHGDVFGENAFALVAVTRDQLHVVHLYHGVLQGGRTYTRPQDPAELPVVIGRGLSALQPGGNEVDPAPSDFSAVVYTEDNDPDLLASLAETLPQFAWRAAAWRENGLPGPDILPAYGLALQGFQKTALHINLLPLRLRKQPSRLGQYLVIALAVLTLLSGLAWGGSVLVQKRYHQARLDRDLDRLAAEVSAIDQLQAGIQEALDKLEFLQDRHQGADKVLDILKALTEILPESAWVREIAIEPDGIRLDGYADAAAELIPLIDASPLFTDVSFLSAITKGRDGKEKFRIGFKLAAR